MKKIILLVFLLNLIFVNFTFAHGDLEERILEVSAEIKKHPDSAYLFVKRGKLYFQHEDYKKSISDLKQSSTFGYYSREQQFLFAKAYYRLEKFNKTLSFIDKMLLEDSKNVSFMKLKAQTYFELQRFYHAAINFEKVIDFVAKRLPENYIDASLAWEALETKEGQSRSKEILNRGIEDLGQLISLNSRLIDLAIQQKKYNDAIIIQQQIIVLSPRKESAYYRLSELYILNDNKVKALECLVLAKQHFSKLPERLKNTSFMKALILKIKTKENLLLTNL